VPKTKENKKPAVVTVIAPDTKDNKKPTVIKVTAPDVHVVDHTTDVHHIDTSSKSVCLHHNTQILFRS
jgi:hypothetical protein